MFEMETEDVITSGRRHQGPDDQEENEHPNNGSQSLDQVNICYFDSFCRSNTKYDRNSENRECQFVFFLYLVLARCGIKDRFLVS